MRTMLAAALLAAGCLGAAGCAKAETPAAPKTFAKEAPDAAAWVTSLSGEWEILVPGAADYQKIPVPGTWIRSLQGIDYKVGTTWESATYRREFEMPAGMQAAVEFDSIRWGGAVSVNGTPVGTQDLGFAPATFDAAAKPGTNRIEVTPVGWPKLPRFGNGDPKYPIGAGHWFGSKQGGITGDVWLRFHKGARIGEALVTAHSNGPSCDVEVEVVSPAGAWKGNVTAQVLTDPDKSGRAVSAVKRERVELPPCRPTRVTLKGIECPGAALWEPANPVLHRVVVWLETDGDPKQVASVREETFGLRDVRVEKGKFLLNGKPVRLFGYSGVGVYGNYDLADNATRLANHQQVFFRRMNATAFRGHQDPMLRKWLDFCDRTGVMVVCEFPNFPDVQCFPMYSLRNPYDSAEYWENAKRDFGGLVRARFNHPSIVVWSATNEGNGYADWERANLLPFVKSADPTRPVMFSSDVTDSFADQHCFLGNWFGTQDDFDRYAAALKKAYPDLAAGCSEFGQFGKSRRWYGPKDPSDEEYQRDHSQLLMEDIETLRRNRYTLIMPFVYPLGRAAVNTGRAEDLPEQFHAMRNAYAPLGVSLEWPRRHAVAGETLNVPVWVMSDAEESSGHVDVEVMLVEGRPGFAWDADASKLKVLAQEQYGTLIEPWEAKTRRVVLRAPDRAADCTLVAVARQGRRLAAISIRPLRVYAPLAKPARPRAVAVIEKDGRIEAWLRARGHRVVLFSGAERPDVLVVGENLGSDGLLRQYGFEMAERVRRGGMRLVMLEQCAWNPGGFEGKLLAGLVSAPLREPAGQVHPDAAMEEILGASAEFRRLNGAGGLALRVRLEPPPPAPAPTKTLGTGQPDDKAVETPAAVAPEKSPWRPLMYALTRSIDKPDWALVHRVSGAGEIFACQVPLVARIDCSRPDDFDPVAERLFAWMIEGAVPPEPPAAPPPAPAPAK